MRCLIHRVPITAPDDVAGLRALVAANEIAPHEVIAILGKTEGNGCVNDYSRGLAVRQLKHLFAGLIGETAAGEILYIMSGGTEGVLSPHLTVISRLGPALEVRSNVKALAAGVARTPPLRPEQIGRPDQVQLVAGAVRVAMKDAAIEEAEDVHLVQIKCPLLNTEALVDAEARGVRAVTDDTYKSMGYSRGASALGAGVALGEVAPEEIREGTICRQWDRFSAVASASAGSELTHCEVLVLGNSPRASGDLVMAHDVMRDAIDVDAVRRAAARAGWRPRAATDAGAHSQTAAPGDLVQVFAKAEADPGGRVRARRHTMLSDSDINHTRHARAVVGGVVAAVFGDPMIYVSGGAEHQGPSGGGPVAVIARGGRQIREEQQS
jgi:cyanuric acid amidohydrolase